MIAKQNAAWLFMGPEIGEKQAAIDEIRGKLGSGTEETAYYAGETPVPAVVSAMRNGSLFADKRLFFIKNADAIKKKDDVDLLSAYIASPSDDTYLILTTEETSVAKALEQAVSPSNRKIFWELSDSRKYEWVQTFFRKEGFRIKGDGVDTILELVENNTAALKQECSRLILFLDKSREVTSDDVEKWLSHTREESVFTLFTRIASGDFSRSLECARILIAAKETTPAIFAGLASCFRKLLAYIALKEAGVSDDFEYKKIGVSAPGAKRDYSAAARRYNLAAAETCLALTAEYDLLLRSAYSFPAQILLERYLYKVHQAG
jgi:DNA polymerase-3 subunit delta